MRGSLGVFWLALILSGGHGRAADAGVWRVAPPPPVSWERGRVADLAARRRSVKQQIGPKGILIL